ncbi:collectin-12-like isoform X7 [Montipora foliosa]|uniref:collectin-12-like isoform X7 n=1 Tax=Montipora foliosa TaxID=591990 RepID=UPI0035F1DC6C
MDEIVGEQVNQCFEMASGKATEYAGMYTYGKGGEQKKTFERIQKDEKTKQTSLEPPANSNKQFDSVMFSRPLRFMVAGLVVCFLTAAAAFGLALTIMFRISLITSSEAVTSRGSANANQTVDGYAALSKSVQDLRQRFTTDLEGSQKSMSEELAKMKNHSEKIGIELEDIKKKYLQLKAETAAKNVSAGSEYSNKTAAKNVSAGSEYSNMTAANNVSAGSEYSNKDNISLLWSTITAYRQEVLQEVEQLDQKIVNISRIQGLRGPPGYNGTQGPPGDSGPRGPRGYNGTQGPPGISPTGGDITLCNYQEKKSSEKTPSSYAAADVSVTEQSGKKIIGANCATNDAKVVLLSSTETGGTRTYQCDCTGTQNTGVSKMYCAVHFWEC